MRWWLPPAILGGLVVIVILVGVVLLSTQDVNQYKDVIAARVSEQTGRELTLKGDLSLSIGFSPSIVAEDVTFENAAWGSRPQMLRLGRLEAKVALFPMLGGDIEIHRLHLIDADLIVETDANGVGNWEFKKEEIASDASRDAEPESDEEPEDEPDYERDDFVLPLIDDVHIENALLTYKDGVSGEERRIVIKSANGRTEGPEGPVTFTLDGLLDELPLTAEARVGARTVNVPLALNARIAGADISLEGTVADAEAFSGLDLQASISGRSLADLNVLGVGELPAIGPYSLSGHITGGKSEFVIENFAAKLGESDLGGTLAAKTGARPRIVAELTSQKLDLDALTAKSDDGTPSSGGGDEGGAGGGEGGSAPATAAEPTRIFSDQPLETEGLKEADAVVSLRAASVIYGGLTLSELSLDLALEQGVLSIRPLRATLAGGTLDAALALNAGADVPTLQTNATLAKVDLAALQAVLDLSEVATGPLDATVDLVGRGASPHALAASLDGNIEIVVGEGRIHTEYINLIATDLLRYAIPGTGSTDAARLNCFVARFDVVDGLATNQALLLDTELTTTAGKGTIDLDTELADLTIVPRPKDASLLSLAVPIVVSGPLNNLHYDIKKEEALLGVAGALLGTALLGPFGVLIPLVSAGTGDENPCVAALKQEAPQQQQDASPLDAPKNAVEDVVKDILKLFD